MVLRGAGIMFSMSKAGSERYRGAISEAARRRLYASRAIARRELRRAQAVNADSSKVKQEVRGRRYPEMEYIDYEDTLLTPEQWAQLADLELRTHPLVSVTLVDGDEERGRYVVHTEGGDELTIEGIWPMEPDSGEGDRQRRHWDEDAMLDVTEPMGEVVPDEGEDGSE